RCEPDQRTPAEQHRAGVGGEPTDEAVQQRRFPGAVRADDRVHRALLDAEVDVAQRAQAAEALVDRLDLQDRHFAAPPHSTERSTGALAEANRPGPPGCAVRMCAPECAGTCAPGTGLRYAAPAGACGAGLGACPAAAGPRPGRRWRPRWKRWPIRRMPSMTPPGRKMTISMNSRPSVRCQPSPTNSPTTRTTPASMPSGRKA